MSKFSITYSDHFLHPDEESHMRWYGYSWSHMVPETSKHQLFWHAPHTCGTRGRLDEWIVHSYVFASVHCAKFKKKKSRTRQLLPHNRSMIDKYNELNINPSVKLFIRSRMEKFSNIFINSTTLPFSSLIKQKFFKRYLYRISRNMEIINKYWENDRKIVFIVSSCLVSFVSRRGIDNTSCCPQLH